MRYVFMEKNKKDFSLEKMVTTLCVSVSGYYAYRRRKPSLREKENSMLLEMIKQLYTKGRYMYGSPRIHAKLKSININCSRKRVSKLMRTHGIAAKMRRVGKKQQNKEKDR